MGKFPLIYAILMIGAQSVKCRPTTNEGSDKNDTVKNDSVDGENM